MNMIKRILNAHVYDLVEETPITEAMVLSQRYDQRIWLKREDLQPVYSFKLRGAYNKLLQLSREALDRGVIAASAGNHAQGLALAASHLNANATIVMPVTTPQIKIEGVKRRGGHVVLHGDTFDEAAAHAHQLSKQAGLFYVHPFDDDDVIAGQGTIGVELTKQLAAIDAVFLPVGGGGLAAGVATWLKYCRPEVKVIAVEPEDAACLKVALENNEPTTLDRVGIFADGVAVARIGETTFNYLSDTIDDVVTCTTDEICAAIKDIFDDTRSIAEPAGALALAGLKKYLEQHDVAKQGNYVAIESGANTNFDRLRYISERTEIGEKREAVLAVTIPEAPGSFLKFCQDLGRRSVTEFNYRFNRQESAVIYVGLQVSPLGGDRNELVGELSTKGYPVVDLTDNELAKLHTRHMVGGVAQVASERVFRTKFPERPGALVEFLTALGSRWNITLFHYRNHGAAYGRVLFGLNVQSAELPSLYHVMEPLGFELIDESENPAFELFMK